MHRQKTFKCNECEWWLQCLLLCWRVVFGSIINHQRGVGSLRRIFQKKSPVLIRFDDWLPYNVYIQPLMIEFNSINTNSRRNDILVRRVFMCYRNFLTAFMLFCEKPIYFIFEFGNIHFLYLQQTISPSKLFCETTVECRYPMYMFRKILEEKN